MSEPVGGGTEGGLPPPERVQRFLDAALAQCRTTATTGSDDEDEPRFDCAELVAWAAGQLDVEVADEAHVLYLDMQAAGTLIEVRRAVETPGALLFTFSELPVEGAGPPSTANAAISLGDGTVIEARGTPDGIGVFPAGARFDAAALIPGLDDISDAAPGMPLSDVGEAVRPRADTAPEPLPDHYDVVYGLAPDEADVGGDGVTDGYDVVVHGARALTAEPDPTTEGPARSPG